MHNAFHNPGNKIRVFSENKFRTNQDNSKVLE